MRHVIPFLLLVTAQVFVKDACAQKSVTDTLLIQEVVIRSNNAIYWNKDTTVYVADSFNHSPHNMAEDVLKKLPGVDVSLDGKISVEGKEVNRIFINGKEAGVNDIRNLTQNLPANIIDRIQLADLQSEESQALGLKETSNEKIINLKLKDEYNNGVYGRAAAGAGSNNLYQGSLFSNYMAGATRVTLIGYANNTGNADVSNGATETLSSQGRNTGTLKQENLNSSFSFKPAEKLDISGSAEFGHRLNNTLQYLQSRTYLPGDTVLLKNQSAANNADSRYARINTRAAYTFSPRTSLNANINASLASNAPEQNTLDTTAYNQIASYNFSRNAVNTSEDKNNTIATSLMLQRNSRKEGRNFVVRYNAAYTESPQNAFTRTINEYRGLKPGTFNNTTSQQERHNFSQTLALKGAEPVSENSLISAEYSLQVYNNKDKRDVYTENNTGSYRDTVQSNDYEYDFSEHNIGLQYQYSHNNTTVNAGLRAQPFVRNNRNVLKNTSVSYSGINYFPLAGFRCQLSRRWRMDANYNGSMRAPSISQVQPAPDYSDSLNITIGNPDLKPELGSNLNVSFNYLQPVKEKSLWVRLTYGRTDDRIVNSSIVTANKRITKPVNASGVYTANISAGYSAKWKKKYRLKAGMRTGFGSNVTFVNGEQQTIYNYFYQPNAGVNILTGFMETGIDYSLYSTVATGGNISGNNNRLLTHTLSVDSKITLPGDISLSLSVDYISNSGQGAAFDNNFVLANAGVYKEFKRPAGLFLKAQGYDLLNSYPNTRRTVYDNIIEDRSYNRIGRYVILSVIYRFSHFF